MNCGLVVIDMDPWCVGAATANSQPIHALDLGSNKMISVDNADTAVL